MREMDKRKPGGDQSGDFFILSAGVDTTSYATASRDCYAFDAQYIRQALASVDSLYNCVHSRVLMGENATKNSVLQGLGWLAKNVADDDIALLFISAHGQMDEQQGYQIYLFEPSGSASQDTIMSGTELNTALSRISGKIIVLIDTCEAAGALADSSANSDRAAFVLSCIDNQNSWGQHDRQDRPHGYYVIAVCEALLGLADTNGDREVRLHELAEYVKTRSELLSPKKQQAVLHLPDRCKSILLAKVRTGQTPEELWTPSTQRNPFGETDVDDPDGTDVYDFAKTVNLPGDDSDPNYQHWNTRTMPGSVDSLDGEWDSRWNDSGSHAWRPLHATIETKGDRVYILLSAPPSQAGTAAKPWIKGGAEYLIDTRMDGNGYLIGRYQNLKDSSDTSPWVGWIVNSERIDGIWNNGRWDLRRELMSKP